MGDANLTIGVIIDDQASGPVSDIRREVAKTAGAELETEKKLEGSSKKLSGAKKAQLSASKKVEFAIRAEKAAGDPLATQLVTLERRHAELSVQLRAAARAGKELNPALVKEAAAAQSAATEIKKQAKVQEDAARSAEVLIESAKNLASRFFSLKTIALGAAAGLLAVAKRQATFAAELGPAARKIGLTVESLQELRFAADAGGVSSGQLETGLRSLVRRTAEAAAGNKGFADGFKALGVDVVTAEGRIKTLDEILPELADGLRGVDSQGERVAIAMRVMGIGGAALLPILQDGAGGLNAMRQEANDLGGVLSETAVIAGEDLKFQIQSLETVSRGLGFQIGEIVVPAFAFWARESISLLKTLKSLGETAVEIAGDTAEAQLTSINAQVSAERGRQAELIANQRAALVAFEEDARRRQLADFETTNLRKLLIREQQRILSASVDRETALLEARHKIERSLSGDTTEAVVSNLGFKTQAEERAAEKAIEQAKKEAKEKAKQARKAADAIEKEAKRLISIAEKSALRAEKDQLAILTIQAKGADERLEIDLLAADLSESRELARVQAFDRFEKAKTAAAKQGNSDRDKLQKKAAEEAIRSNEEALNARIETANQIVGTFEQVFADIATGSKTAEEAVQDTFVSLGRVALREAANFVIAEAIKKASVASTSTAQVTAQAAATTATTVGVTTEVAAVITAEAAKTAARVASGTIAAVTETATTGATVVGATIGSSAVSVAEGIKQVAYIASANTKIATDTATAASGAIAANSGIPVVGIAIGIAAAVAAIAAILSFKKFQEGGIVPGAGRGDIVPALLEPGELVIPRSLAGEIQDILAGQPIPTSASTNLASFQDGGVVGTGSGELGINLSVGISSVVPPNGVQMQQLAREIGDELVRLKDRGIFRPERVDT